MIQIWQFLKKVWYVYRLSSGLDQLIDKCPEWKEQDYVVIWRFINSQTGQKLLKILRHQQLSAMQALLKPDLAEREFVCGKAAGIAAAIQTISWLAERKKELDKNENK